MAVGKVNVSEVGVSNVSMWKSGKFVGKVSSVKKPLPPTEPKNSE
jgi:hypothetical protein